MALGAGVPDKPEAEGIDQQYRGFRPHLPVRQVNSNARRSADGDGADGRLERHAAIDTENLARNVIVRFEKESYSPRHIFGTAKSVDSALLQKMIVLARCDAGLRHARRHHARADYIDPDVRTTPAFLRQNPGRMLERRFLRR